MSAPRLAFFHDSRHPLIYMYETPMAREQHEAAVDELLGTPVDALMFCLGDGRTMLHDTKVGELWGHNVDRWPHLVFRRAHHNAERSIAAGEDPLRVVAERARAKGLAFYPALLVQQGRGPREEDVRCSEFRFANSHLEIGARGGIDESDPAHRCLDFLHDEVREERFRLVEEVVTGYDVDGFELQFNYTPHYFHPDDVETGAEVMTAWVRRVRDTLDASGPGRQLVVRVPSTRAACERTGLDVVRWIDEGLVDVVVAESGGGPETIDVNADVTDFVRAAAGTSVSVLGVLQSLVDSDRQYQGTIETVRAGACNLWAQGVDGLYLGHWFGCWPYEADFYEKLRELADPEVMAPKDKLYFVPTTTGRYQTPVSTRRQSGRLPIELSVGNAVEVHCTTADDLPRWRQSGRVHEVLLRLRLMAVTEIDRIELRFNGEIVPVDAIRRIDETYRMRAPRYRAGSACWFVARIAADRWPAPGVQRIGVRLVERAPDVIPPVVVRDVEIETRYLMGRAHRRGHFDPDLGPVAWGNL